VIHGHASFCGYHMGDYFRHWIKMQRSLSAHARFHVNWFRKDENGKFLCPVSQNMRCSSGLSTGFTAAPRQGDGHRLDSAL